MTVRKLFESCRSAAYEVAAIERQLNNLMSSGGPVAPSSSIPREKVPGKDEYIIAPRGTNNPAAAREQKYTQCETLLQQKRNELKVLLVSFEQVLAIVDDGITRTILRDYYPNRRSDEQIAYDINMSRKTVNWIRRDIVKKLENNSRCQDVAECYKSPVLK